MIGKLPRYTKARRKNETEVRPYVPGEDLRYVSVSTMVNPETDLGFIARDPNNHDRKWYIERAWFDENYESMEQFYIKDTSMSSRWDPERNKTIYTITAHGHEPEEFDNDLDAFTRFQEMEDSKVEAEREQDQFRLDQIRKSQVHVDMPCKAWHLKFPPTSIKDLPFPDPTLGYTKFTPVIVHDDDDMGDGSSFSHIEISDHMGRTIDNAYLGDWLLFDWNGDLHVIPDGELDVYLPSTVESTCEHCDMAMPSDVSLEDVINGLSLYAESLSQSTHKHTLLCFCSDIKACYERTAQSTVDKK